MTSATASLAAHLLSVRKGVSAPLTQVPADLVPTTVTEAYAVQNSVAAALGPVHGWKVGASSPEAEPSAAPLHEDTLFPDGVVIPADFLRHRGVEAEIAWRFAHDVGDTITRETVLNAIGSVHPVIEIVDTRYERPASQPSLAHMADQQSHGALVIGAAFSHWKTFDPTSEHFVLRIDHRQTAERIGGNAAGDPLRLLVWLARHAAERGLPITAGTIVTTGSLSGATFVPHRTHVSACFDTLGSVSAFLA
ncbi:2-keto-4-pentenoate hydratase [Acetobacter estunensis]|uniref:2-keto-4-pentenoate hydratase n=1 Tax=Acetobacter estunensis TaxID=104097 RepID=UPI001C2DCBE6|nr:fumarylacetoacetate hydrolase family protein [Acetobacter estunensis]MBV1838330.1 fumarylacetoacetate hydrolase family protein [Acetobacter estunensis]